MLVAKEAVPPARATVASVVAPSLKVTVPVGVPVPGETVLLLAGFFCYQQHEVRLPYIILVAIGAATLGDNIGYLIGHKGGRRLLERYKHIFRTPARVIAKGERLYQRHGAVAVFFARFIFGMRVISGPLAGVLRMPWKKFLLFNFLGAAVWATTVALVGYFFGRHWDKLVRVFREVDIVLLCAIASVLFAAWWRSRSQQSPTSDSESG